MKVAAAAYPIDRPESWDAWAAKAGRWVADAAAQGAGLAVFPEYGSMELAALAGPEVAGDEAGVITAFDGLMPMAEEILAGLAREHGIYILGGSAPRFDGGTRPCNRATLFGPDGRRADQDKQILTRYERETWNMQPRGPLRLFDTALGRIGVLICYDVEFPMLARALVEAGAEIILAPSCTDTMKGFHRVEVGARARALEGQCITVQAPTVGAAPWCPAVDRNHGAAGVFGPPDAGFPDDGVLARGEEDTPGWVIAEVDTAAVATVRTEGRVLNFRYWAEQTGRASRVARSEV